jgi:hypothetical protein
MSAIPVTPGQTAAFTEPWTLPSKGRVGMLSLIIGESAIFTIFVVAYIYYIGKSLYGPTPAILEIPWFNSIALLSSSVTIWLAEREIERGRMRSFAALWGLTMLLGVIFIAGTGVEWHKLIDLAGGAACDARGGGIADAGPGAGIRADRPHPRRAQRARSGAGALLAFCRCGVGGGFHGGVHRRAVR